MTHSESVFRSTARRKAFNSVNKEACERRKLSPSNGRLRIGLYADGELDVDVTDVGLDVLQSLGEDGPASHV